MSRSALGPRSTGNKFREVARSTENPATKLLAEGLTALAEALRELDDNMGRLEQQVRPSNV